MTLNEEAARELELYIDNDGDLYRSMTTSILKNQAGRKARGQYNPVLAQKLWMNLMDAGAKKYAKEFASPADWNTIFSVETRHEVARRFERAFEQKWNEGEYRDLAPKKYQGKLEGKTPPGGPTFKPKFKIGDKILVDGKWPGKISFVHAWDDHLGDYRYKVEMASGNRLTFNEKSMAKVSRTKKS